ncbi:MAG: outer membrane protein assembly factor BamA [Candidatus Tectomicrobia bacterium]|uniref:Outer membrane protein assembly factor BamA n=1 Tax=Tectimicrobiota bacterium TaxID=2528274 RepID=A0A932GR31_UNCTE|nr:outer membrane protein assembly factor BamA [Candidatus Tectomicrobia bacterium]
MVWTATHQRKAGCLPGILALVLLFFLPLSSVQGAPPEGQVRSIRLQTQSNLSEREFRGLLLIKEGEPYDLQKISDSVKRLYQKGMFADILVDAEEVEGGVALTFRTVPQIFVGAWRIRGNRALSRSQLSEGLTLSPPPILSQTFLSKQVGLVRERCREFGYEDCKVRPQVGKPDGHWVVVTLEVSEGPPTRIDSLLLAGNRALNRERVLKTLGLQAGRVFDRRRLQAGIERLEKDYRDRGFLFATVDKPGIERVSAGSVRIRLALTEGPRVLIRFQGNRFLSAKALRSKLTLQEDGDLSPLTLQKNTGQIQFLYLDSGFPFARVESALATGAGETLLKFTVDEGPRVRVDKIGIQGNARISRADVLAQMLTRPSGTFRREWYVAKRFEDDLEAVRFLYRSRGYLQAEVAAEYEYSPDTTRLTISVTIVEGEPSTISRITLKGNQALSEEEVRDLLGVRPGDPFNQVILQRGIDRLLDKYVERGFGEAQVSVERSAPEAGQINLGLDIEEGKQVRIGQVIVQGNLATHSRVVTREMTIKEGDPYSRAVGARAARKISRLGIFSRVDLRPAPSLDAEEETRDLVVEVNEAQPKVIEFGFGYGSEDRLRGFVEASHRNLGGWGRTASLRAQKSSIQENYSLSYREPWLFDLPVSGTSRLEQGDLRKRSYTTRTKGIQLGLEKPWGETYRTTLAYRYSGIRFLDVDPSAILEKEDQGRLTVASIAPTLIRDSRNDAINPFRGSLNSMTFELSSQALASEVDFYKVTGESRWYFPLATEVVLALGGRVGWARSFGPTAGVPITERFFAGGSTTVRGYRRDELGPKAGDNTPTGGNFLLIGNAEIRFPLFLGLNGVVFVDSGNVWTETREVSVGHLRTTTGLGLRYGTPIGPFRLDYGHKLNRAPGETAGEFYFTLGYPF